MARTIKTGLDYFPFDVDFFMDEKIEFVAARFGTKGELIAVKLLCKIYRSGYYTQWTDDDAIMFAKRVGDGVTPALVNDVVNELVKRDFFNKDIFNRFKILTSRGIQNRYVEAKDRAKQVDIIKEYFLLDINETAKRINVNILSINDNINSQRREKKRKEEENKKEEIANPFDEKFLPIWGIWKTYKQKQHKFTFASIESEQASINDLVDLSGGIQETAEKIIRKSMANGWQGLFKLKKEDDGTKKRNGEISGEQLNESFTKFHSQK